MKKLYDPSDGIMRVVGLMSGSGTNMRKLLEYQKQNTVYQIVALFSDNANSHAVKIGKEFDVPVIVRDIDGFFQTRQKKKSDLSIRSLYDTEIVNALSPYKASVAAYAGYMRIASEVLVNAFLGVNVHPADLSIRQNGKRAYTGNHAVEDAIRAGEKYLRSSTHLVTTEVDGGPILLISQPVPISDNAPKENQQRLKELGDWIIFPRTLEYLAQGKFGIENNIIHFDGVPIPNGLRIC